MKPMLRDMVRVGISVAAVTGLVLLPTYFLRYSKRSEKISVGLQILSLEDGWNSTGVAINDAGDIVGTAFDNDGHVRAFIQHETERELLPLPKGASRSAATGINTNGLVIGNAGDKEYVQGVLWRGKDTSVLTSGNKDTVTTTISGSDVVAGVAAARENSFLTWKSWDVLHSLTLEDPPLQLSFDGMIWKQPGEGKSIGEFVAQAGNAEGTLAGMTLPKQVPIPALWKAGRISLLPTPEGASLTSPLAINQEETAVGVAVVEDKLRPIHWSRGHAQVLPVPGDRRGIALGISNQNTIVGVIETESGRPHAAMWQDGKMIDLDQLVNDKSGWTLVQARGINNHDQIVGTAVKGRQVATFVFGCRKRQP